MSGLEIAEQVRNMVVAGCITSAGVHVMLVMFAWFRRAVTVA